MPASVTELIPYKSLILSSIRAGVQVGPAVSSILNDVTDVLSLDPESGRRLVTLGHPRRSGDLTVGFLHYEEDGSVTWTNDLDVVDTINHLALVCRRNRHVAIYLSDTSWRTRVMGMFDEWSAGPMTPTSK